MPTTASDLSRLVTYNDWANERTFAALDDLSPDAWSRSVGGSFGSIPATAAHLVAAEWLWLERWRGESPTVFPDWSDETPSRLAERLADIAERRRAWLDSTPNEALEADLAYRQLAGAPQTGVLATLVRHVVNHSTYHRGQLAAFLRNVGQTPPSTDLVVWDREIRGG